MANNSEQTDMLYYIAVSDRHFKNLGLDPSPDIKGKQLQTCK